MVSVLEHIRFCIQMSATFINLPLFFVLWLTPTLTMMYLRSMLYLCWTPQFSGNSHCFEPHASCVLLSLLKVSLVSVNLLLDSEIKYSNWKLNHSFNYNAKCFCLDKSNSYEWIGCDCDKEYPFICKRNGWYIICAIRK